MMILQGYETINFILRVSTLFEVVAESRRARGYARGRLHGGERLCSAMVSGAVADRIITVTNACPLVIWPAFFSSSGRQPEQTPGWEAQPNTDFTFSTPENWVSTAPTAPLLTLKQLLPQNGRVWVFTGLGRWRINYSLNSVFPGSSQLRFLDQFGSEFLP
ncbi:hypothetical protein C8R45DRAFT_1072994 [Mycena sanguinolenta]|nr:hypothetical protein C8R45DRAFT_1072994 [Mycena sanguinolenta]